ncbi:hypothetical protein ACFL6U_19635 [Planctomycetota bacterium]
MKRLRNVKSLVKTFDIDTDSEANEVVLAELLQAQAEHLDSQKLSQPRNVSRESFWVRSPRLGWTCSLAAVLIAMIAALACFDLAGQVANLKHDLDLARRDVDLVQRDMAMAQQEAAVAPTDNSATINLYLKEHRDVITRHASFNAGAPRPTQMRVSQHDILYYEFLDDGPEYMRPGIIVRGPPSQREIGSPEAPVISNGHTLTLSEAQETAGFALQAPSRLHPCYELDQIRRIDGRDALQLLYTDGIHSVSLFEQSLDGQRGLSRQDFREYAVYRNTEQTGGTILAWRDDALSYVLIGNTEMAQLMNMAQSISAGR